MPVELSKLDVIHALTHPPGKVVVHILQLDGRVAGKPAMPV